MDFAVELQISDQTGRDTKRTRIIPSDRWISMQVYCIEERRNCEMPDMYRQSFNQGITGRAIFELYPAVLTDLAVPEQMTDFNLPIHSEIDTMKSLWSSTRPGDYHVKPGRLRSFRFFYRCKCAENRHS